MADERPTQGSPQMAHFETIVNFAVDLENKDDAKAAIIRAADKLLMDSLEEMSDAATTAVCLVLLNIYQTGRDPGETKSATLNELKEILLKAHDAANYPAKDSD